MKRSEINRYIDSARKLFDRHGYTLPPFALWSAEQWKQVGHEADEIRSRKLGWDITDFGSGNFQETGLTLFTVRNGKVDDPANQKTYAEKAMVSLDRQVTPFHFHWMKTEDIINRGGGKLVIELYNGDRKSEAFTDEPVIVSCDGVTREVKPGGRVVLEPGESITLVPYVYHKFYGEGGDVFIGEVSSVNDDATDNRFKDPLPRYPKVEEDEPARLLLCNEYPAAR